MSGKRAVAVSKTLSWLLRHGAEDAGLRMSPDGYVRLSEVLSYPKLSGVKVETVEEIVASCDKQRFALVCDGLPSLSLHAPAPQSDRESDREFRRPTR